MTNSNNATSKCFSGILRRLLCTGSLPTHPSDLITEPNKSTNFDHPEKDLKNEVKAHAPATPGIVARLMGLDSLPDFNWAPKERALDSILRSRSVNSVDYLPEFDLTQPQHRRIRTSVSFREVPTFLQQQNLDFFVLCFERAGGSNKMSLSSSKSEMGLEKLKQQDVETERNRENSRERKLGKKKEKENQENKKKVCKKKEEPNKVVHRQPRETLKAKTTVKPQKHKETSIESKLRNKKKSRHTSKKVEPICNSENSSPVSVLDLHNISSHHSQNNSSGDSRVTVTNPREKSSSNVANYDNPPSNPTQNFLLDDPILRAKRNRADKTEKTRETQHYAELVREIFRLTEEDVEESNWVAEKVINFEDVEEICNDIGQQILDLLFHQVVDELVGSM